MNGSRCNVVGEERARAVRVAVLFAQIHVDAAGEESTEVGVHDFQLRIIRSGTRRTEREKDQRGLWCVRGDRPGLAWRPRVAGCPMLVRERFRLSMRRIAFSSSGFSSASFILPVTMSAASLGK